MKSYQLIMIKIYKTMILIALLALSSVSVANPDWIMSKEEARVELNNAELVDSVGLINGTQYAASVRNGHYLVLGKLTSKLGYEPIAIASLGDLPYPAVEVKDNAVVVNAGYANHGNYTSEYIFNLKANKFQLLKYLFQADYNENYTNPSVTVDKKITADFNESTIYFSSKRMVNNFQGDGYTTKEDYTARKNKKIKISPSKNYLLDGFDFDLFGDEIDRLIEVK